MMLSATSLKKQIPSNNNKMKIMKIIRMKKMKISQKVIGSLLAMALISATVHAQNKTQKGTSPEKAKSFYKKVSFFDETLTMNRSLFTQRPSDTVSLQTIDRFGPVGIGIELHQPAFVMKVKNVEKGSPAEAAGKLKAGQIIETINGQKLKDIDPRIQLGRIITAAEAKDGVVKLVVREKEGAPTQEVVVKIPVLGAYSPTWPLDCSKSDKIIRDFAKAAAKLGNGAKKLDGGAALYLLSTGDEKDLDVVRKWYKGLKGGGNYSWFIGYEAVPVAEYYLRTGDKSVLPAIQAYVDGARDIFYCGSWAGRAHGQFTYMGGGHMNAAGTNVVTFLLLAKECGVNVDEVMFRNALIQYYRYVGRGNNPYGDGYPETSFVDNGRNGSLAYTMAAGASLTPNGENSVYAKARDASAIRSYYTTGWMLHGHTGGGIGEIWRSAAMGLVEKTRPKQYRSFMDSRKWWYELSRRYDGSFGVLGGGSGYDKPNKFGFIMGLTYTAPRKTLRITGAPPSKYSKPYKLPVRPWGTEADDAFLSMKGAVDKNGNSPAVEEETLTEDHPKLILLRLGKKDVTEETVRKYVHHQDHTIRMAATQAALGIKPHYLRIGKATKARFPGLVVEMLNSKDPRVRWCGAYGVKLLPSELLTDGNFKLLAGMINDPKESWYGADMALQAIATATPEQIGPHVDRLVYWMQHEDWWMSSAAIGALLPVMGDERYYKQIFPALGNLIAVNQRFSRLSKLSGLAAVLWKANPEVQQAAAEMLATAYQEYPKKNTMWTTVPSHQADAQHLKVIATCLSNIPHGLDKLYVLSRKRFPNDVLPHRELFLASPHLNKNPVAMKAVMPIIKKGLILEHVGKNYVKLKKLAAVEDQAAYPGGNDAIDTLASFHKKTGDDSFGWHMFADIRYEEWDYHSFNPIASEHILWDQIVARYRDVTMPKGMEKWYALDFDAKKNGWKRGKSAFGQYMGRLPRIGDTKCSCLPDEECYGNTIPHTLWEKEVLLLRGTFKIPKIKPGYRYRLRVNEGTHVGLGGGFMIYVNGKEFSELKQGTGRGGGEKAKGGFITKDFLKDFQGQEVTIAVKTFLRFNQKYSAKPTSRTPQGRISLHFEEQKLPPINDDQVIESATVVPFITTEWQEKQFATTDAATTDATADDGKLRYDGEFVTNSAIVGDWTVIDQVVSAEAFTLEKIKNRNPRSPYKDITFGKDGRTSHGFWQWSGEYLMDLDRYQGLKMKVQDVGGENYLFVEVGQFSTGNKPGWKSQLYVLKRK
jgi:HEAT repeat protein